MPGDLCRVSGFLSVAKTAARREHAHTMFPTRFRCITIGILIWTALVVLPVHALDTSSLRLVPFPKKVEATPGTFALTGRRAMEFEVPSDDAEAMVRLLGEEFKRAGLRAPKARLGAANDLVFRLHQAGSADVGLHVPVLGEGVLAEGYALDVGEHGIVCVGKDPAGLFHGLQTVCQLVRANRGEGNALPCMSIQDWPSLRWRCFQDDMTRGPSSTLETLKVESGLGASLKFNLMTFYMEYQYAFSKHPQIGPTNGSLTPGDLAKLVEYTKPLHLDILGNQQSFGHFGAILKHPEFAALRETADVLTPVREETYQLLDDLYSEVCPVLPFPWFNVCCDETDGLGAGPSKDLASRIGVGGVYVQHIRRVHDLLRDRHGKRMMMWGDIILQHPDKLSEIPKDTIMLTWGYDARASFEDQIVPFARSGYEFFVCPGVNNWSRILPDFGVAVTNIQNFVRDGIKHGALGMINTDWEDDGEAINASKWHADAWAAECAWNASTTSLEAFNRRAGAVLFGERGDHFGRAVELLTKTHPMPGMKGMMNGRFWDNDFAPRSAPATILNTASNLLSVVRPALEQLEACRKEARCNQAILDAMIFGAQRMERMAQRQLDGLKATELYQQAYAAGGQGLQPKLREVERLVRVNQDAQIAFGRRFAELWLAESKPYALDWTLRRYTNSVAGYDALLSKIQGARKEASAGRPLPAPEDVGLALPRPVSRTIRPGPAKVDQLDAAARWEDASSKRRMGLRILASNADRMDLPVELELDPDPASQPNAAAAAGAPLDTRVRAFLLPDGSVAGQAVEIPAQLDPIPSSRRSRLLLVVAGKVAKGTAPKVHVYFGGAAGGAPPSGAVAPSPGPSGMQWLENDRVRVLLGPEGGHLYRWQVKGDKDRDLTMPGDTGWAGFSDQGNYRDAAYRINCTARGSAMLEYRCEQASGPAKTIRLYAGASWVEVFLEEPAGLYWDFDNPANFAADGPTPGAWIFSDGKSGRVGREADGVPAQVKATGVYWGVKYNASRLALGLITPEVAASHVIAPGAGAGGVGIESSVASQHFVTFAGLLDPGVDPAETMNSLRATLDLKHPVQVELHGMQSADPGARKGE